MNFIHIGDFGLWSVQLDHYGEFFNNTKYFLLLSDIQKISKKEVVRNESCKKP